MKTLEKYGINLENSSLLTTALTHTSYANEHNCTSYERLEFLGDAILEFVSSEYIYTYHNYNEGLMSKNRSLYVCENALYEYAKDINLKDYIRVGNSIRVPNKTVIADVFEAVIAVIYLELGMDKVKEFFNKLIVPYIESNVDFLMDYKTTLQEMIQTSNRTIEYKLIKEGGPAHRKYFIVEVIIDGMVYGSGKGNNKKEAEQKAAKEAISKCA